MVNFYVKNDSGEYVAPTEQQIDDLFKEKSEKIISQKLSKERGKYRAEIDGELRKEVGEKIKAEIKADAKKELEAEYQQRLSEAESRTQDLENQLLRKKIATEYGFKSDVEDFLGNGTEDEMRAKADALKNSFGDNQQSSKDLDKKTTTPSTDGCVTLIGE